MVFFLFCGVICVWLVGYLDFDLSDEFMVGDIRIELVIFLMLMKCFIVELIVYEIFVNFCFLRKRSVEVCVGGGVYKRSCRGD